MPKLQAQLLSLPAELRNQIYSIIAQDINEITIRHGKLAPHPLSQVCRQARHEFTPMIEAVSQRTRPLLEPSTIKIQVENFDFTGAVHAIDQCVHDADTRFEIEILVTKQLSHKELSKMWAWIHFCDALAPREDDPEEEIQATYKVTKKCGACNVYAACHEIYVEVVPYVLQGNGGGACSSAGFDQIEKMKTALERAVGV